MFIFILILFFMTFLGSFAGMFLKKASGTTFIKMLKNYNIYLGAGLYLLAALLNVYILTKLDYSFVLPFTSITYVWTMCIAYLVLKEKISIKKILGVGFIVCGAVIIAIL